MKKLEKCKIVPQAKFVKFKMKHFVEIPTIRHDKAVPPLVWLPKIISPPPPNVSPPWLLKFSSCPSCLADDTKIIPPPDPMWGRILRLIIYFSIYIYIPFFLDLSFKNEISAGEWSVDGASNISVINKFLKGIESEDI